MTWESTFAAGTGVAIIGPTHWFLTHDNHEPEFFQRTWQAIATQQSASVVLGTLLDLFPDGLPDFVLAQREAEQLRIFTRGAGTVTAAGTATQAPSPLTWNEQLLDPASEITLEVGLTAQSPGSWPCTHGMFPASRLKIRTDQDPAQPSGSVQPTEPELSADLQEVRKGSTVKKRATANAAALAAGTDQEPAPTNAVSVSKPAATPGLAPPAAHVRQPVPVPQATPISSPALDASAPTPAAPLHSSAPSTPVTSTSPTPPSSPESSSGAPTQDAPPEDDSYDSLFGATVFRTVEAAAVREVEEDSTSHSTPVDASLPLEVAAGMDALTNDAVTIQDAPALANGDTSPPGAFDSNQTVLRSSNPAAQSTKPEEPSETAVKVPAKRCGNGHLNAPHAFLCRVCNASEFPGTVFEIGLPPLGVLEFSTGQSVPVDRPIFIGRSPAAAMLGEQMPALIALAVPDISRSHVEIRIEGWTVLVVDLNSSNGTVVSAPGKAPRRLRPNEPVQITPGTEIELAETVTFVFTVEQ